MSAHEDDVSEADPLEHLLKAKLVEAPPGATVTKGTVAALVDHDGGVLEARRQRLGHDERPPAQRCQRSEAGERRERVQEHVADKH